jgi:endonuclease YncB( thermonuclease family)
MANQAPELGWTTSGVVSRVIDGDTVEFETTRRIRVRLRDCWAPESHLDRRVNEIDREAQKLKGIASAEHLRLLVDGKTATLHVPTLAEFGGVQDMTSVLTLGRVIGDIWTPEGNVAEIQVARGYATRTKGGV